MKQLYAILVLFFLSVIIVPAQTNDKLLIQFSGIVIDQDSIPYTPIPFVSIAVNGKPRCNSDFNGFFSVVVQPGDEIQFVALAYKNRNYKIADSLKQKYYYAVQVMTKDTVQLPSVDIFPWPSKEEFKRAFLALNLTDSDVDRAEKNLHRDAQTYLERNQTASAAENYRYLMLAYYTKAYTAGQQPSISLLNPMAWAQFIDAIKKGKYSKKKKTN